MLSRPSSRFVDFGEVLKRARPSGTRRSGPVVRPSIDCAYVHTQSGYFKAARHHDISPSVLAVLAGRIARPRLQSAFTSTAIARAKACGAVQRWRKRRWPIVTNGATDVLIEPQRSSVHA